MLFSPRLSSKDLSDLAHRLSVSLAAGVDLRRTWQRETEAARGSRKDQFAAVQAAVDRGDEWGVALAKTEGLLPPLFVEMVKVGEQTGQTAEVLDRLSSHYRFRHDLARMFMLMLAWPVLQLVGAVVVIGLFIWILGEFGISADSWYVGNRGLALYSLLMVTLGGGIAVLVVAMKRGALWAKPIQRWVTQLPGLGRAIQKICLARIAWTLHLLLNVDMDLRQVIPLVMRSSGNDYYAKLTKQVVKDIAQGQSMTNALAHTGAFPNSFLDALNAAEESGQISESMARLSKQYEQEAERAMKWIAGFVAAAVWLAVAALITTAIFVIFFNFVAPAYRIDEY